MSQHNHGIMSASVPEDKSVLKIAICDDEKEELEKTVSLLSEILKEENREYDLATYHSPSEMIEQGKEADIALLDVDIFLNA